MPQAATRHAALYRMVMDKHVCPWGLKARDLLIREGFQIEDHWLKTKAETDAYKAANDVKTTPQIVIGGKRIGGYEDLRRVLGKKIKGSPKPRPSGMPVIAASSTRGHLPDGPGGELCRVFGNPFTPRGRRMVHRVQHVRAGDAQAARPGQLLHHVPGL